MSKKANPAVVGSFVIGAVILAVAAVIAFGGGKLFQKKNYFVMYFEDSLGGLDIGAPVEFKGVRVGTVVDVQIFYEAAQTNLVLPVTISLEPDRIARNTERRRPVKEGVDLLVQRGMRAQLVAQSLLTGKLKVQLDYFPDVPPRYVAGSRAAYPEIPTAPSPMAQALKKFNDLPVAEIVMDTRRSIRGLADVINATDTREAIDEWKRAATSVRELTDYLEQHPESLVRGKGASKESP